MLLHGVFPLKVSSQSYSIYSVLLCLSSQYLLEFWKKLTTNGMSKLNSILEIGRLVYKKFLFFFFFKKQLNIQTLVSHQNEHYLCYYAIWSRLVWFFLLPCCHTGSPPCFADAVFQIIAYIFQDSNCLYLQTYSQEAHSLDKDIGWYSNIDSNCS